MKRRTFLVPAMAVTAITAWALPVGATQRVLTLDPEASQVGFNLKATGENVHGLFHLRGGEIVFDTDSGEASGEVVVEAFGADTGGKKRDKKMHTKVLESERYPLITFRPDRIEGELEEAGSSEIRLHGTMVLLGAEHPMTLPGTIEVDGDRLKVTAAFDVPFVEWGLHDPSFLVLKVAKIVNLEITTEGLVADAPIETLAASGQ